MKLLALNQFIKFKRNIKIFVGLCYLSFTTLFLFLTKNSNLNLIYLFYEQVIIYLNISIKIFDKNKPKSCLKAFKTNNFIGIFIFFAILSN